MKSLIIFDLETTSTVLAAQENKNPEIIEIGAVKIDLNLNVLEEFHSLVQPENLEGITPDITNLTKLRPEYLKRAERWIDIWPKFLEFTEGRRTPLCCWGWTDYPILVSEYRRLNLTCPHNPICFDARTIVVTLAFVLNLTLDKWTLDSVANYFSLDKPKHRALEDARTVLSIFRVIRDHAEFDMGGIVAV